MMWDGPIMPIKPVQISIDTALLERIDADPEARSRGRSAFVRSAIERYLNAGTFVGTLGPEKMRHVCQALSIACGCD